MAQEAAAAAKKVDSPVPIYKNKLVWLCFVWVLALIVWFIPTPEGLTVAGQHAMAVVVLTIGMWLVGATPPAIPAIIMLGIVSVVMRDEIPATDLFRYWTQETMWFIMFCFAFAAIMKKSGLGNRVATYVFSIKNPLVLNFAMLFVNFLFSLIGMAASLPKLTLLFPILVAIATMSGIDKENRHVRRVALMINLMANNTGILIYTGFNLNTTIGGLGGFEMNYTLWLQQMLVPALCANLLVFFIIYFMYRPKKDEPGFDVAKAKEMRKELGKVKPVEWKTILWILIAILFWATSAQTKIGAGFATVLVIGMMMLPKIGLINFKDFTDSIQWTTVFMLMGVLAFSALGGTGFTTWLVDALLPASLPNNPIIVLLIMCFFVEILHIALGSIATSAALLIPTLVAIGPSVGLAPQVVTFVTFILLTCQAFFPYQNVAFVAGQAYNLWEPKDLLKTGLAIFFTLPILLSVVLYPFWVAMGWIG
jgi:di/tricarboxylate transporter